MCRLHLKADTDEENKLSSGRTPTEVFFSVVAVVATAKPCVLEILLARLNGEVGVEKPLPTPNHIRPQPPILADTLL